MGNIPTVGFAVESDVFNCGIRSVQCGLEGFRMRRDREDSPSRSEDLIVGSGRSGMEDDDVCRDYVS